jgi:hypothetical protein
VDVQEDKKKEKERRDQLTTAAVRKIADTEAGVIFFTWLKEQCFYERSIISGNAQSYEVNTLGSIAQEFQRRLYLNVRRAFSRDAKIKIEVGPEDKESKGE